MEAFAMSVRGFREQKRWGMRIFVESTQTDGKSEEGGMEGELCVRGVRRSRSIGMG